MADPGLEECADARTRPHVAITMEDLHAVERVITTRFAAEEPELRRAARMRRLVRVTGELAKTLSVYARDALVHCQGTAGACNLSDDTERLGAVLAAFAQEISTVARDYPSIPELKVTPTEVRRLERREGGAGLRTSYSNARRDDARGPRR